MLACQPQNFITQGVPEKKFMTTSQWVTKYSDDIKNALQFRTAFVLGEK